MKTMKLALATAAIAACTTVFAADAAASDNDVEGQGIGAIGWTPVQVGLFAPVSIPWGFDWDVKGFDLDLFYIENFSVWLDLRLIILTVKILFMIGAAEGVVDGYGFPVEEDDDE